MRRDEGIRIKKQFLILSDIDNGTNEKRVDWLCPKGVIVNSQR
jgi:hypothetical protein